VLGLASSGLATVRRLLLGRPGSTAPPGTTNEGAAQAEPRAGVTPGRTVGIVAKVTALVISPGIPNRLHEAECGGRGAACRGKPIICDIELLARAQPEAHFVASHRHQRQVGPPPR